MEFKKHYPHVSRYLLMAIFKSGSMDGKVYNLCYLYMRELL